jgi:ketosteroid isomerase-like protein
MIKSTEMKKIFVVILLMQTVMTNAQENKSVQEKIIGLEKAALERWYHGDPSGFIELYATDIVYFDPFIEKRVDGLAPLTKIYEAIRGQVKVERYEMIDPLVQVTGVGAVLTFNLNSYVDGIVQKWNCTEAYRLEPDGSWKISQSHWSLTQPALK